MKNPTLQKRKAKRLKRDSTFWKRYFTSRGSLPSILVLGAPKCGTTSLYNYLCQHESLQPPHCKEICYFAGPGSHKSLHWYKSNFIRDTNKPSFDVSPPYMYSKEAAYKIKKLLPNGKFIILLRNPVDRLFSHYNFIKKNTRNDVVPMQKTFEELLQNLFKFGLDECKIDWIKQSNYLPHIKNWFAVFPDRSQTMVVKAEDFYADPQTVFNAMCDHVEIPHQAIDVTPKNVGVYKESMSSETRSKLEGMYREHNRELETFLGQQFNWY